LGLASLEPGSVWKFPSTSLNDHVRDDLSSVFLVLVSPFLHLPLEGCSSDFFDSNGDWLFTIHGWSTHDHDWLVEVTLDWDLMPGVLVILLSDDITKEQDASGLGSSLWHAHVDVKILAGESHVLALSNSEGPFSGNIDVSTAEDLDEVVTLGKFLAEVK